MKKTTFETSFVLLILLALFLLYFLKQKQSFIEKENGVGTSTEQVEAQNVSTNTASAQEQTQKKTYQATYIIKNNITPDMLAYTHWSGSYKPSIFAISAQGTYIKPGQTHSIVLDQGKPITIRYDYSFMNGYKTGSREISFMPPAKTNTLSLTFSWHESAHLILQDAKIVGETVLPFNTLLEKMDTHNYQ
jgi:hypothetical protein